MRLAIATLLILAAQVGSEARRTASERRIIRRLNIMSDKIAATEAKIGRLEAAALAVEAWGKAQGEKLAAAEAARDAAVAASAELSKELDDAKAAIAAIPHPTEEIEARLDAINAKLDAMTDGLNAMDTAPVPQPAPPPPAPPAPPAPAAGDTTDASQHPDNPAAPATGTDPGVTGTGTGQAGSPDTPPQGPGDGTTTTGADPSKPAGAQGADL